MKWKQRRFTLRLADFPAANWYKRLKIISDNQDHPIAQLNTQVIETADGYRANDHQ